ncbi:MAG TPA: NAD(P)(+) transhydrogenase (Re/Si-specific) subunit beta [Phycisphaerae bacterium]|jgi:NAD(P) transhydrogenase subunit beta|nr:NAD(P)(+) transhydrogenase (Re/Si-specific) subunit beta [Phycisphaerae bacterium]HOB73714.1 NAD(P)(+) transhydrogenase (Re/Si-specific) subunit beta [Phycisphaerae bacterium]HOJ53412.1 NAD(P)(+) transhydrogenase (Re/Si-specific) subunit beta [Phycisphaerae bacterium]HOL25464.1 NAD(P)(+) transhydrogenase (Re/Si-specific) subunit beta [Phycisphaerae bacterium]HPP19859.1 NAD(P)(+) transhydrogenase (Re/Si-specific) subunit beta [Phycisphaerae bacterium]
MTEKLVDLGIVVALLLGIALFRTIRSARAGNLLAALALLGAVAVVWTRHSFSALPLLLVFAAVGSATGLSFSRRVSMVGIPAMVALQNGMGGMASFLVSFVELTRSTSSPGAQSAEVAALLGIVVGTATFTGSLLAAGRLAQWLAQKPVVLPHHSRILGGLAALALLIMVLATRTSDPRLLQLLGLTLIVVAGGLGIILSVRVGGADMPVLISFLNAGSGVAAAFCGLSIGSWLLIAAGAMVGVSGMILTQVMCRAMNRNLVAILTGRSVASVPSAPLPVDAPASTQPLTAAAGPVIDSPAAPEPAASTPVASAPADQSAPPSQAANPFARALDVIRSAQRVIIVPGYGMALAEAQEEVSRLADKLTGLGREVIFAVHPVAGRMPGHMHVLLAEAEVDYGMIREMAEVNPLFATTDLALIVGACDVVNPAASQQANTPISGMPILQAHEAKNVIVCNLDDRPGYSGVENLLYRDPKTIMLLGDAQDTLRRLLDQLDA